MKYAFITGGAGGLGLATAKALEKLDYTVFCGDFNDDNFEEIATEKIIPIHVDVTDNKSVDSAIEFIKTKTDTLDVVINCAGGVCIGSLVEVPTETYEKLIETNLLGMYRINKATFEMVRAVRGRFINVSSEYGVLDAVPFHTFYTSVKHAVEVYSEGLRRELAFFQVPVVTVRPGAFKTNMQNGITQKFDELLLNTTHYKKPLQKMQKIMSKELEKAKETDLFVFTILKAITAKKPRRVYAINNSCKMKFLSSLPSAWQDKIYLNYFKIKKEKV